MDFKVRQLVDYAGTTAEVVSLEDDGFVQIKYRVAGQNRVRLVEAFLLKAYKQPSKPLPGNYGYGKSGSISNSIITSRNGGVRHQFIDSIGGCSSNYR